MTTSPAPISRSLFFFSIFYGGMVCIAGVLGNKQVALGPLAAIGPMVGLGPLAVEAGIFAFLLLVTISSAVAELHGRAVANRLVRALGAGAFAALSVSHAGVAVFLSALAAATGETRDDVASSTGESQLARLALSLRAAGLGDKEIEREFFAIHPDITLPDNFAALRGNDAQVLLTGGTPGSDPDSSYEPER